MLLCEYVGQLYSSDNSMANENRVVTPVFYIIYFYSTTYFPNLDKLEYVLEFFYSCAVYS